MLEVGEEREGEIEEVDERRWVPQYVASASRRNIIFLNRQFDIHLFSRREVT